ncbi:MAG: phosphonate ABC transporter, permease protein PhnE [Hyphomicrobiales bacterium]|uniref:phosphonate ABC transporter, permease protein PhnE n=1 Tax=Rhabdaerophilum calidifontis TaxID=2604328 RepID=UPI00123BAE09|nr:phosphonate ABC transporter, permease protein PhnE [Rhabdaerophilum calidifontis]MCA1952644.1 phosphonate ABC transporter, permease protein PhnE [Hyphomicrobiales bacterium]MCA1999809.1 phosphonate ABC transporter, permease protein PhnE [Hyphomicrobiales bacterium]
MAITIGETGARHWRLLTPGQQRLRWLGWLALVALTILCWRVMTADTIWAFVSDAPRQAQDIFGRMLPPRWRYIDQLWMPLWDTINIATLGTLIAILLATPLAFLAARNTTPSAALIRPVALFIIVASRSINALIWGLLLVAVLGPGVLAGIIAIALRSIGFIGKLLYEAIEEIDESQVEAIRATGASQAQIMGYGIWPQIMPAFATISVFRWDINIRESTVLGLVGAGGLGLALESSLNTLAWPQVSLILLLILVTVVVSEWVTAKVRKAII